MLICALKPPTKEKMAAIKHADEVRVRDWGLREASRPPVAADFWKWFGRYRLAPLTNPI
jgi:hypothetical protein